MHIHLYIYIYKRLFVYIDYIVSIFGGAPVYIEKTLFSVTTVSRQIKKRLFLGMTFSTSSKRLRSRRCVSIYVNNRIYI